MMELVKSLLSLGLLAVPQQQQPINDWFYCRKPDGYYTYVKECPGGWPRVAPQPPLKR